MFPDNCINKHQFIKFLSKRVIVIIILVVIVIAIVSYKSNSLCMFIKKEHPEELRKHWDLYYFIIKDGQIK